MIDVVEVIIFAFKFVLKQEGLKKHRIIKGNN